MPAPLPASQLPLLVRVDFRNDQAWTQARDEALAETADGFRAYVDVLDDRTYDGVDFGLLEEPPAGYESRLLFVFDEQSRVGPDHPLLVIDFLAYMGEEERFRPGRMRAAPDTVQQIENNLTIANMDFEDFADSADPDGVFRDFPQ